MLPASIEREQIGTRYQSFAQLEAAQRSPLYSAIARAIAADPRMIEFLAALPSEKRQPNLLLGVVRYLFGTPSAPQDFIDLVLAHRELVEAEITRRSTQTNEPARCATLLPVLAQLPQPLALLEVGAAAGLCLLPDRYGYDYGRVRVAPAFPHDAATPVFRCRAAPATPLPQHNISVVWRAGLDLAPVDLRDESQVRWLEALVWPGEEYRLPLLRAACEIARADPPRVLKGDLRVDLPKLAAQAPGDATLFVFHTAVLAYVADPAERVQFARGVQSLDAVWIANEGPEMIPGVPAEIIGTRAPSDDFLMCVDGHPVAWADGHGTWIDWR